MSQGTVCRGWPWQRLPRFLPSVCGSLEPPFLPAGPASSGRAPPLLTGSVSHPLLPDWLCLLALRGAARRCPLKDPRDPRTLPALSRPLSSSPALGTLRLGHSLSRWGRAPALSEPCLLGVQRWAGRMRARGPEVSAHGAGLCLGEEGRAARSGRTACSGQQLVLPGVGGVWPEGGLGPGKATGRDGALEGSGH